MHHITLNTGHTRETTRDEIDPPVMRALRDTLRLALTRHRERVPMPGFDGYTLNATDEGDLLIVTAWREDAPLCTIGVARSGGRRLWELLHKQSVSVTLATDTANCPVAPWVASRLDVGIALYPDAADWLGDFARCVAWAWIAWREDLS